MRKIKLNLKRRDKANPTMKCKQKQNKLIIYQTDNMTTQKELIQVL